MKKCNTPVGEQYNEDDVFFIKVLIGNKLFSNYNFTGKIKEKLF